MLNPFRILLIVLLGLAVVGCDSPQNFLTGVTGPAEGLAGLGWGVLITFSAVTVIVWLLIFWLALRRRGTFEEHAPIHSDGGLSWLLIGGLVVPVAILGTIFVSAMATMSDYPLAPNDKSGDITVVGERWWFTAHYPDDDGTGTIPVPTEIHIPVGKTVDIELESRDVIHSFWVPKLHGKVDLVPGQTNYIRLKAGQPGFYSGQCGEYCGLQHTHMRVYVVAQTQEEYDAWLANQRAPAREPQTQMEKQGREIFETSACALCHTIRGTEALGSVGPDLTHVASREYIAGGMLKNNTANLAGWIIDAQSHKPGSRMPNLTQYTGEELRALVAYLQSLE